MACYCDGEALCFDVGAVAGWKIIAVVFAEGVMLVCGEEIGRFSLHTAGV